MLNWFKGNFPAEDGPIIHGDTWAWHKNSWHLLQIFSQGKGIWSPLPFCGRISRERPPGFGKNVRSTKKMLTSLCKWPGIPWCRPPADRNLKLSKGDSIVSTGRKKKSTNSRISRIFWSVGVNKFRNILKMFVCFSSLLWMQTSFLSKLLTFFPNFKRILPSNVLCFLVYMCFLPWSWFKRQTGQNRNCPFTSSVDSADSAILKSSSTSPIKPCELRTGW